MQFTTFLIMIIYFYYIDTSVLLENTLLVKFIRHYIQDHSGVFSNILTSEDIDDFILSHCIAQLPNVG